MSSALKASQCLAGSTQTQALSLLGQGHARISLKRMKRVYKGVLNGAIYPTMSLGKA